VFSRGAEVLCVETNARFLAGELDDVADAGLLTGINKSALRLQQSLACGRDHENSIHIVERGPKRLGPKHIALHDLHCGKLLERKCLRTAPDERPHWFLLSSELSNHGRPA